MLTNPVARWVGILYHFPATLKEKRRVTVVGDYLHDKEQPGHQVDAWLTSMCLQQNFNNGPGIAQPPKVRHRPEPSFGADFRCKRLSYTAISNGGYAARGPHPPCVTF